MESTNLLLIEHRLTIEKMVNEPYIQQIVTAWLKKELNHPTKDACAILSAQAFKINSCQTAAQGV